MSDLPYPENEGQTHYVGCWRDRGHHNCAIRKVEELRLDMERYQWLKSQSEDYDGHVCFPEVRYRNFLQDGIEARTVDEAVDAARRDQ